MMAGHKRIALTAHDALKPALAAWAFANESVLSLHALTATGNTGQLIATDTRLKVDCVRSGALGGDMELGAMMAAGRLDLLIFFADPLSAKPHDIEPWPLVRMATLAQVATALNEATADFLIRSELLVHPYHRPRGTKALPAMPQQLDARRDAI